MLNVEVRVRGVIAESWWDWFDGLVITESAPDETILRGQLRDQVALYGLLAKLRDLRFQLVSVQADEHKQ